MLREWLNGLADAFFQQSQLSFTVRDPLEKTLLVLTPRIAEQEVFDHELEKYDEYQYKYLRFQTIAIHE